MPAHYPHTIPQQFLSVHFKIHVFVQVSLFILSYLPNKTFYLATGYGTESSTLDRLYEISLVALVDFFAFLLRVVRLHSGLDGAEFTVRFSRGVWSGES